MKEDYFAQACFECSEMDRKQFAAWTVGLPIREEQTPMHCGPHSVKSLQAIVDMIHPRRMVEIGFCVGFSASIWLNLGVESIICLDNSDRKQTIQASEIMKQRFGNRFWFYMRENFRPEMAGNGVDAVFVDGAHDQVSVEKDIDFCDQVNAKFIICDDIFPRWGPGVLSAIEKKNLVPLAIFGNIGVFVRRSYFQ